MMAGDLYYSFAPKGADLEQDRAKCRIKVEVHAAAAPQCMPAFKHAAISWHCRKLEMSLLSPCSCGTMLLHYMTGLPG